MLKLRFPTGLTGVGATLRGPVRPSWSAPPTAHETVSQSWVDVSGALGGRAPGCRC